MADRCGSILEAIFVVAHLSHNQNSQMQGTSVQFTPTIVWATLTPGHPASEHGIFPPHRTRKPLAKREYEVMTTV